MISILIIDDNLDKVNKIIQIIENYSEIASDKIDISNNITDAKRALRKTQYDFVILDLQLPLHENEDPIPTGGIDLLNEIHNRTIYKKPHCIMGLSAFLDKVELANPLFDDKLWSVIYYDPHSSDWSDRIDRKIEYILESTKTTNTYKNKYNYNLAIITALPKPEFDNVLKLTNWIDFSVEYDSTRYFKGQFTGPEKKLQVVAACSPQMGMPATAVLATKMISHFQPEYICMVGITAGARNQVDLGDIIVADPTWDWASGKLKPSSNGTTTLLPDPLPERLDPKTRAMIRDAEIDKSLIYDIWDQWPGKKTTLPPKLRIGPCVSGASVVADGKIVQDISSHSRKLLGLEMEAYGLMHAASNAIGAKPQAFSMKSVCDFADETKSDDIQAFSAFISANLLKKLALKYF